MEAIATRVEAGLQVTGTVIALRLGRHHDPLGWLLCTTLGGAGEWQALLVVEGSTWLGRGP